MRASSRKFQLLIVLCLLLPLLALGQKKSNKESSEGSSKKEFFEPKLRANETEKTIQELREEINAIQNEMDRMRTQLREYDDLSSPRIRKEIKRLVNFPEEISEITFKNGTVVQGRIVSQDIDKIVVQTSLGTLSLGQDNIQDIKPFDRLHADVVLKGDYEDQRHSDSRVFVGQIVNKGMRRADFVRVRFNLHDNRTNIIAQDSSFISGEPYTFYSGVVSESSLSPKESSIFRVEIKLPPGMTSKNISYVTYKILFDEYN